MSQSFGMGGVPRPKDKRDYKLGYSQSPVQIPAVYMPDVSSIPVKMQGTFGTCGAHAGAMLQSFAEHDDFSPKFLWAQIKQIDGFPLDAGTDMRSIFKALQNVGVCHESLCPDTLPTTIGEYSDPKAITDAMLNDAYPHGVTSYAFIDNPSWDQIRQAIYQNKVIIALLDCGDGWWANGWSEGATCPLKLGNFASHHFVTLWGYDRQYIYFRNSWSTAWGRSGDGYFDRSYLPHVIELGTAIDGPSIKQRIVTKLTLAVQLATKLYQMLLALKKNG